MKLSAAMAQDVSDEKPAAKSPQNGTLKLSQVLDTANEINPLNAGIKIGGDAINALANPPANDVTPTKLSKVIESPLQAKVVFDPKAPDSILLMGLLHTIQKRLSAGVQDLSSPANAGVAAGANIVGKETPKQINFDPFAAQNLMLNNAIKPLSVPYQSMVDALRGLSSAQSPVNTKAGDLDLAKTAIKSSLAGMSDPERTASFSDQILRSLPKTHPVVARIADLFLQSAMPLDVLIKTPGLLKTAVGETGKFSAEALYHSYQGAKELGGKLVEKEAFIKDIQKKNPKVSREGAAALHREVKAMFERINAEMGAQAKFDLLAKQINPREPFAVSERAVTDKKLEAPDERVSAEEAGLEAGEKAKVPEAKPKAPHIAEAEKVGKVIGIDAETKLPIIDTKQKETIEKSAKLGELPFDRFKTNLKDYLEGRSANAHISDIPEDIAKERNIPRKVFIDKKIIDKISKLHKDFAVDDKFIENLNTSDSMIFPNDDKDKINFVKKTADGKDFVVATRKFNGHFVITGFHAARSRYVENLKKRGEVVDLTGRTLTPSIAKTSEEIRRQQERVPGVSDINKESMPQKEGEVKPTETEYSQERIGQYLKMDPAMGYLRAGVDVISLQKRIGAFSVVVKDVNGYRARFSPEQFAELTKHMEFSDRIREVFIHNSAPPDKPDAQEGFMAGLKTENLLSGQKEITTGEPLEQIEGIKLTNSSTISISQKAKFVSMISNNRVRALLKENGIVEINIQAPYKFSLSEQANLVKGKKIININADATDPTATVLHELGHAKFESLSAQEKIKLLERAKNYDHSEMTGYKKIKAWEEIVADSLYKRPDFAPEYYGKHAEEGGVLGNEAGFVIFPGVKEASDFALEITHVLNPKFGVSREAMDTIMKKKGELDKIEFELERKLRAIESAMEKWPRAKQVEFIDNIKRGVKQADPKNQIIAEMMKKVEDAFHAEASIYKPGLAYKEHHYRVLWRVIPGSKKAEAKKGYKGLFRRPLQGTKGWTKRATLEDMSEGLDIGGEPYSYNPMTMWRQALMDMQKFITTQRMWKELKNIGNVKFVRLGQTAPEGFVRLNDRLAKVYFPVDEGLINAGEYFVEENAARVLNNFLSRDLIRESAIGRGLLALKNVTTSIELAISPFHLAFESVEMVASSLGLGLQKMVNRGFIQQDPKAFLSGLKDILLAGISPVTTSRTGGAAIRFMTNENFLSTSEGKGFIKAFPLAKDLLDDLFLGGGKLAIHQDYKTNSVKAFQEGLKNKEPWAVTLSAIPAFNETIMKPLFEVYIPRLKIGLWLREYSSEIVQRKHQLESGVLTRAKLASDVWDSIENRFGEMNFDNLFWDRTFKSATQLTFRSVTWKLGSIVQIAGAAPEQIGEFQSALKSGKPPLLGRKIAWLIGLWMLVAAFSAIVMALAKQGRPKNFRDLVAPRYDDDGNRISLNSYLKDLLHFSHSPVRYITSSMSGEWGRLFDLTRNKDYYGTEIYSPDDSRAKQLLDQLQYLVPLPFYFSGLKRAAELKAPAPVKTMVGAGIAQPAPGYMNKTEAQMLAHDMMLERLPIGARTQAQAEASLAKSRIAKDFLKANEGRDMTRIQSLDKTALVQGARAKEINLNQANFILKHAGDSFMKRTTRTMSWFDIPKIMEKATPEELPELEAIFIMKVNNEIKRNPDEADSIKKKAIQMFRRLKRR